MKVFVLHYTKLKERREHIEQQLAKYDFDVEFITDYDKEDLTSEDLQLFNTELVSPAESSLIRKHIACYERICKYDLDYALIFEDDVTLVPNFKNKLDGYIEQLPKVWDLFFIGEGGSCKFHIPDSVIEKHPPGTNVFYKSNYSSSWGGSGASRCADSYMVSNRAASRFLEYLDHPEYKIAKEADHLINEIALFTILKVYWAEPTLVTQESDNGKFQTSLDGGIAARNNLAKTERIKQTFIHIENQKFTTRQKKLQEQRETATKKPQSSVSTKTKDVSNTDRPLASIRPVAGRRLQPPSGGSGKGRFSKFSF